MRKAIRVLRVVEISTLNFHVSQFLRTQFPRIPMGRRAYARAHACACVPTRMSASCACGRYILMRQAVWKKVWRIEKKVWKYLVACLSFLCRDRMHLADERTKGNEMEKLVLLIDGHHGQYIPHLFCMGCKNGEWNFTIKGSQFIMEAIDRLSEDEANEKESYWDDWNDILSSEITFNGERYNLWQDGDLWAVHESTEWDDFGPIGN